MRAAYWDRIQVTSRHCPAKVDPSQLGCFRGACEWLRRDLNGDYLDWNQCIMALCHLVVSQCEMAVRGLVILIQRAGRGALRCTSVID